MDGNKKLNMQAKLLTTREVSQELGLSEKEIIQLAQDNKIPHFRIGGEFFRFKKEDILKLKAVLKKKQGTKKPRGLFLAKSKEFIYFNDFYIAAALAILVLLWLVMKDFF